MKKAIKFSVAAVGIVAALGAAVAPSFVSAWGDNSEDSVNMRPSYTEAEIDAGKLGDKITFNSISDNKDLGDEKNFMSARMYNDTDLSHLWQDDEIMVEDGKEYVIRMYVHNNSPKGRDGVAKDVRAYFQVPNESAKSIRVRGYLNSSNATPTKYWDDVYLKSDTAFHLEPVGGSARIYNKGVGKADDGAKLSDELVTSTNGVLLGFDSLNGEIPGCFEYDSIVTMRVKAYYDRNYTVETKVRLDGDTDKTWKKSVDAKIGDIVEFQINYKNTSSEDQRDVAVDDQLPANLRYVPGSTRIMNGANPNGATFENDDIYKNGIWIGSYGAGANALIRFKAEVVDETFTCGLFTLRNWGRVGIGTSVIQDSADVNVQLAHCPDPITPNPTTPVNPDKPTEVPTEKPNTNTPSELPTTGPVAIAGSVIGVGSIVTAAGYYVASRRALR